MAARRMVDDILRLSRAAFKLTQFVEQDAVVEKLDRSRCELRDDLKVNLRLRARRGFVINSVLPERANDPFGGVAVAGYAGQAKSLKKQREFGYYRLGVERCRP